MSKPDLHEIAAMPYPASMLAMRKHYNKDWHKLEPDGTELFSFKVDVVFSYREQETRTYAIEAFSEDQAKELAEDAFERDKSVDHTAEVEVDEVEIVEMLQ